MSTANEVRRLRQEKEMTMVALGKKCGVSQQCISCIELGQRKPSPELAKKIGAALGFPWTRFFEEGDDERVHGQHQKD